MKLSLSLLLVLFAIFFKSNATTFTVTSNADSGSGTLREALFLASANGSTQQDFIHFNLPGNTKEERTITIYTELPYLSANLILDATTQPGANLGSSNAKIILKARRTSYIASSYEVGGLNILNISDIEIYGFCFEDFSNLKTAINPNGQTNGGSAIRITSSTRIKIGAPAKGNVFTSNGLGVHVYNYFTETPSSHIKIQSNWFGLNLSGIGLIDANTSLVFVQANDSEFGGPDFAHGNILGGYSAYGATIRGNNGIVRFNRFGYNGDGTIAKHIIKITISATNSSVTDNLASKFMIDVVLSKQVKFLRNTEMLEEYIIVTRSLEIKDSDYIQLGSDDILDANTFQPRPSSTIYSGGNPNISILKNIIHCTPYTYLTHSDLATKIQVLVNNDSEYAGKATPGAEVYIYNDYTDCASCSPLQFFAQVTANSNGDWKINGDFSSKKFIANATLLNTSSEFSQPQILPGPNSYLFNKSDPTCGKSNGMIELTRVIHTLKIEWYTLAGNKIGEGSKIENLAPGRYYAKAFNGKCYTQTMSIDLLNIEAPLIHDNKLIKQNPGCGMNNGSIRGLYFSAFGGATFKWVDENNKILTTANLDLNNIGPGKYSFIITGISGCINTYGPIILENTDGPSINAAAKKITSADCQTKNGAIDGLTTSGVGILQYSWRNESGILVGNNEQLNLVAAGTYTLTVKDQSACEPVSEIFIIPEKNEILIDIGNIYIEKPTCRGNNGAIKGTIVNVATSFKWIDETGRTVSSQLELIGIGPGSYSFVAYNATCELKSNPILVEAQPNLISIGGVSKLIKNASCGLNNGSIQVMLQNAITPPVKYRWTDKENRTLSETGLLLDGMTDGLYNIYGIDANGCEILLASYEINRTPMILLNKSKSVVTPDECNQKTGSLKGLTVSGGVPPLSYNWKDENGQDVSSTLDLLNVSAGNYTLNITDAFNCNLISSNHIVNNENKLLPIPVVNGAQICSPGNAIINVANPNNKATYKLYDTENSIPFLKESNNGIFEVEVLRTRIFYVSEVIGSCESSRSRVIVTVGISNLSMVNIISPNNDQINDVWKINSIENYPKAIVQIFNRAGNKVFESVGYKVPFDGKSKGKDLPNGVYYYVINFGTECKMISGSLTIIK